MCPLGQSKHLYRAIHEKVHKFAERVNDQHHLETTERKTLLQSSMEDHQIVQDEQTTGSFICRPKFISNNHQKP
jgi:hypothetical protein